MTHPSSRHWRGRALCLGANSDLWFPVGTTGPALEQAAEAKSICYVCPVQQPCLLTALRMPEHYGIFGGTDEHERKAIIRWLRGSELCYGCMRPRQFCACGDPKPVELAAASR